MPAVYHKLGLRFVYPENWTLDESEALEGRRSVAVYSPGGSFWSVSLHPREADPAELVAAAVKALRETYDELDAEEVEESLRGRRLVGADLNFYYLDLTNTALVRAFTTPGGVCVVLCQADDREFAQIGRVMQAMTVSLLDGFSAADATEGGEEDADDANDVE